MDLNAALDDLACVDERRARVVEMRFFGGMPVQEIALTARISTATVERKLCASRLWLMRRLAVATVEGYGSEFMRLLPVSSGKALALLQNSCNRVTWLWGGPCGQILEPRKASTSALSAHRRAETPPGDEKNSPRRVLPASDG